ncbi:hypothetical protein [Colwellia sp. 12G3]|uniref:hypothetical protein n=1 Tax=Colwellia sp. 12G3 TaxID=2058299 RepID=UPI000C34B674|nr:hypothetical protein [Colwellia sp. 12G3]PKI17736.1 hypothetical protein CXF71_02830 [Colwellia sp. 12G3]
MSKIIISITETGDAEATVNGQATPINDLKSKKGGDVSFENSNASPYSFTFAEWPFEGENEVINVSANDKQKVKKTLIGPAGSYAFTYSQESSGGVGGGLGGSGGGHIVIND